MNEATLVVVDNKKAAAVADAVDRSATLEELVAFPPNQAEQQVQNELDAIIGPHVRLPKAVAKSARPCCT